VVVFDPKTKFTITPSVRSSIVQKTLTLHHDLNIHLFPECLFESLLQVCNIFLLLKFNYQIAII
jgi:hypothetical protein